MRHDAWFRNWVIAAVAILSFGVILMLSACVPPPPPPPPAAVTVVGDSISFAMQAHGRWNLGRPVKVNALPGRRLDNRPCGPEITLEPEHFVASSLTYGAENFPPQPTGLEVITLEVALSGATNPIVVELGTNDISDGRACIPATWAGSVAKASSLVPANRKMVWVVPYRVGMGSREHLFDTAVFDVMGKRPGGVVVDWFVVARDHPGYIGPDGTHPTPAGEVAFNALVAKALTCNCKVVTG